MAHLSGLKIIFLTMIIPVLFWNVSFAESSNLKQAVEHYQNADFEKAKKLFEESLKQKAVMKTHQIALTYLALIEMANGNMPEAEKHIFELLLLNPRLTLETIGNLSPHFKDYTSHPDFQKLFREAKSRDLAKPSGQIIGIGKSYEAGAKISYQVRASDDRALKKLTFLVKNSAVKKEWETGEPAVIFKSSFSTNRWHPGSYAYMLRVDDMSGKSVEYNGHFLLTEPADRIRPTGTVSKIKEAYYIGETVSYAISGKDNEKIKKMTFLINGSTVKEWSVGKPDYSDESSFETANRGPGEYEYVLLVEDSNKNIGKHTGSFVLRSEKHEKLLHALSANIAKYNSLKEKEKRGENVAAAIVPVLIGAIENLDKILASYKEFSLSSSEMREKSERANNLLVMFKNELSIYEKNLGEMIENLRE